MTRGARLRDHFSGEPRQAQADVLPALEEALHASDVVVLEAPVAAGKTRLGDAMARWTTARSGAALGARATIVAPNNLLVDQYLAEVRGYSALHRKGAYRCVQQDGWSCEERQNEVGYLCKSFKGPYAKDACPYTRDLRSARSREGRSVVNQHIYLAHKLYSDVCIFDEAHTLHDTIASGAGAVLWRSVHGWRRTFQDVSDVAAWLHEDVPQKDIDEDDRLRLAYDVLHSGLGGYTITIGEEDLRGRPTECVRLVPLDVKEQAKVWFPHKVRKVVLMSATISAVDVEALGLAGRRVSYVRMASSIPVERRPLHLVPVADGRFSGRGEAVERYAEALVDELLPSWPTERGLVHAPYSVAAALRHAIGAHPRLVWAGQANRREVVGSWLTGGGPSNAVLVASGVHEGLDLKDDLCRFQALTVTPRPSLADPGMAHLARHTPHLYEWRTIRALAQAYGRVCRHPLDFGATFVLDSSAEAEFRSSLLPSWVPSPLR